MAWAWAASRVGPPANPDFCKRGSDHPSAKVFPINGANRHLSVYDPKSGEFRLIRTCFPTHHIIFAEDADNTLWASAGGPAGGVVGWLNRRIFDETGDEQKAQGWTPVVLDTNGAIRAMVGGMDYGKSQFNRAIVPNRQPGSAFKLFDYATAFEMIPEYDPDTIVSGATQCIGNWCPQNYSRNSVGRISLISAFQQSINTVPVNLSIKTGASRSPTSPTRSGSPTISRSPARWRWAPPRCR